MSGFKTWQIFAFSLVPLALVFIGVIGGSIHGSDSSKENIPAVPSPVATPAKTSLLPGGSSALGSVAHYVEITDPR